MDTVGCATETQVQVLACRVIPRRCDTRRRIAPRSANREVSDVLPCRLDFENLLHALYDDVLDEPVPARLRNLLPR